MEKEKKPEETKAVRRPPKFFDEKLYKAGVREAIPDLRYGAVCCPIPDNVNIETGETND